MSAAGLRLEAAGGVATLTFDRPEARNAIDRPTMAALAAEVGRLEAAPPRAVMVTGAGDRAFVAAAWTAADHWRLLEERERRRRAGR